MPPSPHELGQDDSAEQGVGDQIAAPEPAGLLLDAVEPFEAESLPRQRSSLNLSRENVERAPDTVADRHAELVAPAGEEALLLRGADPDQQDVRLRGGDGRDNGGLLRGGEVAVMVSDHADVAVLRGEPTHRGSQHAFARAEAVDPVAVLVA